LYRTLRNKGKDGKLGETIEGVACTHPLVENS